MPVWDLLDLRDQRQNSGLVESAILPPTPRSPFIKWPGGKRWLSTSVAETIRAELCGRYIEPFLGGGAVFFALQPRRAVLSDVNSELINLYEWVQQDPDQLVAKVWRYSNTAECFYRVRASRPRTSLGRAARMLYLSRTCFGGIYRLNQSGEFNVPFGGSGRVVCRRGVVRAASGGLRDAELRCLDFEGPMGLAGDGDVVYVDPPFARSAECSGFRRYNERTFKWSDQERLAEASQLAKERGAMVLVSAPWHEDILRLYRGFWAVRVDRNSRVSRSPSGRRRVSEAILFSRLPNSTTLWPSHLVGEGGELATYTKGAISSSGEFDRPNEAMGLPLPA